MKAHSDNYKNQVKLFGRELDSKITYDEIVLTSEQLNSVSPHYESSLLKSVMKQLDIDSNVDIPVETEINYQFGIKINDAYEYLDFGNYIVYSSEKQEDSNSYKIIAYDKMLYAMKDYENLEITYPITIKNYLIAICNKIGLTFKDNTFANQNREIQNELFLDSEGNSLGYTYRDVLDQIAETTGGVICLDINDELEVRYVRLAGKEKTVEGTSFYIDDALQDGILYEGINNITQTNSSLPFTINLSYTDNTEGINEEYLKDINVNFGEKYGPINSIVLSRAGDSDNVYIQDEESIEQNGLCELKISDNQIMNFNDREDYLPELLSKLDGLEYYLNDFSSTGITYYDLMDRYNVTIGENTYSCIMFNDEINVTQGLEENIHTKIPEKSETDYKYASKTDRTISQAYIIVKKNEAEIEALSSRIVDMSGEINGIGSITLENAYVGTLHRIEISGNINKLLPMNSLQPSNNLIPLDTYLIVDNTKYLLDIDYLSYTSVEQHDTFIYEDGKCWIERANGTIEEKSDLIIQVNSNSTITMEHYNNAIIKCIYLLENEYTDTFTNQMDLLAQINLTPGNAKILANKIKLEGYTTINENFGVDLEGNMWAKNGSFSGNIYLEDGNKILGGDGLYSCLSFTGTGRYSGWEILGFSTSGYNLQSTETRYADVFVNAYIPENFVVESAYIILECSSMYSAYEDAGGGHNVVGEPKQIKLFKGSNLTTVSFFYYPYQAVDEYTEYSGTEVPNAFEMESYTPTISYPGSVDIKRTIDISDSIDVGFNTFFVRSTITPKPVVKTFRPSGATYDYYNYEEIVKNTGIGRLSLYVYGFMNISEEV